jgi:LPS export ABC transporter permease LptF/LPS export ABC transporter permease LptG
VLVKILDRYLVREIVPPLLLALLGLTFVLMMPPIMQNAAQLIAKGVPWSVVFRVLLTLTPQALSVTIPMALLYGVLFGLGRMSADREFVALQACGVSIFRVLRPIALLAMLATAATAYETIVALPDANQTFREITFNVVASGAESDIKPRVFFTNFTKRVLYVRDIQPATGWRDVFVADATQPDRTTVYVARQGRLAIDREKKKVELVLENGTVHTTFPNAPEQYDDNSFDRIVLDMDAQSVFPRIQIVKGDNEKTIAELRETAADNAAHGVPNYSQLYTIQQKFSLPAACLVLALIGLALGASNRKDGKLASFAFGTGVVFVYYVLLYSSRAAALGGRLPPGLAPWLVNVVLGAAGVALVFWRARSADQPIRISIPTFWRRAADGSQPSASPAPGGAGRPRGRRVVVVVRIPHIDWPRPTLLDLYVSRQYVAVFVLAFAALVMIFYISTFIDLADKVLGGTTTTGVLLRYFYFATPQYVYYIIPMAALVATLVTVGLLTKNSELIVMRACGISLYRSALPLLLFGIMFGGVLYGLQEYVLPEANREATRLNAIMRGYPVQEFGVLNRQWIIGKSGDIYRYEFFDPRVNQFSQLSMFHLNERTWKLDTLTYAKDAALLTQPGADGQAARMWMARGGWTREFTTTRRRNADRLTVKYTPFTERALSLEPPSYFKTEEVEADRMTYGELKDYIAQLKASGYHVVPYMVQLQRKVAFPFVTLVMTLLAVPFAVTTGRSGAFYGIGVGIVLALVYWTALSVFGALGAGGWMSPMLAAWAPNILFGAAAVYMLLTVRT